MSLTTSQKPSIVTGYVNSIITQSLGYSFGKPLRCDEKSLAVVLPILRKTSINRQYITYPETEKLLVFDSGNIEVMDAENQGEQNVFIRSGTIFKGSTQARAIQRSAVVFPGKKQSLKVRCVHKSHGIRAGSKTTFGGLTPHEFETHVYDSGFKPKDQHAYWRIAEKVTAKYWGLSGINVGSDAPAMDIDSLRCYSGENPIRNMAEASSIDEAFISSGAFSSSAHKLDDLSSHMENFANNFEDVLSKVKLIENQAGLALINQNGVETVEVFDHPDSWKALHESAVKRLGSNIVEKDEENVFTYSPEVAQRKVSQVLAMDWELTNIFRHRPSNGEPEVEITGLSSGGYVGELVEINNSLAHLIILKKAA